MKKNDHPTHPVRNFFYLLWTLVNTLAFVGFFVAISLPVLPYRAVWLFVTAVLLVLAVVFGIFRPLFGVARR